jgi:hypothetical protein
MAVRLSALCAGHPLPPGKIPGIRFCWKLIQLQCPNVAGRIRAIEKSSDLIGNRTHDLPPCSIVQLQYVSSCCQRLLFLIIIDQSTWKHILKLFQQSITIKMIKKWSRVWLCLECTEIRYDLLCWCSDLSQFGFEVCNSFCWLCVHCIILQFCLNIVMNFLFYNIGGFPHQLMCESVLNIICFTYISELL